MTRIRCRTSGCNRWATADSNYCSAHLRDPEADTAPNPEGKALPSTWTNNLLPVELAEKIAGAGEDPNLTGELSMLRFAAAKVMIELSDDPIEQARLLARLAAAAATVARANRVISGAAGDQLIDHLTGILTELGEI